MDGRPLWAYPVRLDGRDSPRIQRGGFPSKQAAQAALERELRRLLMRRCGAMTLTDRVEEYLDQHQAEPETTARLRWLLSKSLARFGPRLLPELNAREIAAWRMTIPEGHRFEATQALRQVLARAVLWQLIDSNPAVVGVTNTPLRRRRPAGRRRRRPSHERCGRLRRQYGADARDCQDGADSQKREAR
jgi:hypothetical protein